jgi:hypothetical protein
MANKTTTNGAERGPLSFTRVNALLGVSGLITMSIGYWLLARGSITAAPLLLVLAYIVLLPLAIIL